MPTADKSNIPRTTSKRTRFLPSSRRRSRPGLAVDTSLGRPDARKPEQLYPLPDVRFEPGENFVSLNDIKALSLQGTGKANRGLNEPLGEAVRLYPGPQKTVTRSYTQQSRVLESAHAPLDEAAPPPYNDSNSTKSVDSKSQAEFTLQHPPRGKRTGGLPRPVPPKLRTDISPSDCRIPIGIAVSPGSVRNHKYSLESAVSRPQSSPQRRPSHRSAQGLKTPTIVITPAEEDFEAAFNGLPEKFRPSGGYRPRSSVYSRHTSCIPEESQQDQTPPVPPLPSFALEGGSIVGNDETRSAPFAHSNEASRRVLSSERTIQTESCCTTLYIDDEPNRLASAASLRSNRLSCQTHLPTPRRSRGWWNLLTSPFSASSASKTFFPRASAVPEEQPPGYQSFLSDASKTPLPGNFIFKSRSQGDEELRSAPATECSMQTFGSRQVPTPKRSDTAPGALDLGNAAVVNIYRAPSQGAASSYYDPSRRYPSLVASLATGSLDRGLEQDWSPSQSVYRGSASVLPQGMDSDDRGFTNMPIPTDGEAAAYFDPTRQFSRVDEPRYVDRGFNCSGSASGDTEKRDFASPGAEIVDQRFVESPVGSSPLQDDWDVGRNGIVQPSKFQTPGSQSGGVQPYAKTSTVLGDRMVGGTCNSESTPSTRDGSMTLDGNTYPTAFDSSARAPYGEKYDARSPHGGMEDTTCDDNYSRPSDDYSSEADLSKVGNSFSERANKGPLRSEEFNYGNLDEHHKAARSWHRRFLCLLAICGALLLVVLVVLLAMFIPFHHADMTVQAQWLNFTGFPPLPTGVATVVGANSVKDVGGCVSTEALWNCAVPPGQHGLSTTRLDQPNFRFLIRFRNGTISNDALLEPTNSTTIKRDSGRAANAGAIVKRSAWSSYLYTSSPSPPATEDQIFLGRTSDDVDSPYNGEETPFYISLLNPTALQPVKISTLQKRNFRYPYPTTSDFNSSNSASSSSDSGSSTPNAYHKSAENIPLPVLQGDGKPASPVLYPFAYAQPLRLFNRGQENEHYGFYTYFDRSIFISGLSNGSFSSYSMVKESFSSNVLREDASAMCIWSQSRLLVQIWTRKPGVTALYPTTNASNIAAVNSTANDMRSPGSFPYAVTITLDRHGGDASKKGVYCYGLDKDHHISQTISTWIAENRAFDGKIVNPAGVPTNNGTSLGKPDDGKGGGVDGGTGGCACQWQNSP